MNEKISDGRSILGKTQDPKEVAETILSNSMRTRKREAVTYRPFKANDAIYYEDTLSWQNVDFGKIYPSAKDGDGAYIEFNIICVADEEILLNVSRNTCVYYNGKMIFTAQDKYDGMTDMEHLKIFVRKNGENNVKIFCRKNSGRFSLRFLISVIRYPFMWANDYLFWARAVIPETREYEEGVYVSDLIEGDFDELPHICRNEDGSERYFDFNLLYGKGNVCYIYTEAQKDGEITFCGNIKRLFIDGQEVKREENIAVKAGNRILACFEKNRDEFSGDIISGCIGLDFITSSRKSVTDKICLGPFQEEQADAAHFGYDMSVVYENEYGEKLYWRFSDGSHLRIYLDSIFFGQWFYALMVGLYGLRSAGAVFGNAEAKEYFAENMSFMAKHFEYIRYEAERFIMPTFMPRIAKNDVLDNLGTMGMNFADAYSASNEKELLDVINYIADRVETAIPRFEDGTYFRRETMWADDLYMSCPFLVRMGNLTGNEEWYKKAVKQIIGFKKRLYIEEEHLFSHIYFANEKCANKVTWGRGNGWVMWTLSEILANAKTDLHEIKTLFCDMAEALRKYQSDCGLWRQVIDSDEEASYPETSSTGMFLLALARGVRNKWLDESFVPCIKKAWCGLLKNSIDEKGNVYGVCMGSGCAMDKKYYYSIPTIINDDHGTGVILTAASEYKLLLEYIENKKG